MEAQQSVSITRKKAQSNDNALSPKAPEDVDEKISCYNLGCKTKRTPTKVRCVLGAAARRWCR